MIITRGICMWPTVNLRQRMDFPRNFGFYWFLTDERLGDRHQYNYQEVTKRLTLTKTYRITASGAIDTLVLVRFMIFWAIIWTSLALCNRLRSKVSIACVWRNFCDKSWGTPPLQAILSALHEGASTIEAED
jgi:hypothetical protein